MSQQKQLQKYVNIIYCLKSLISMPNLALKKELGPNLVRAVFLISICKELETSGSVKRQ